MLNIWSSRKFEKGYQLIAVCPPFRRGSGKLGELRAHITWLRFITFFATAKSNLNDSAKQIETFANCVTTARKYESEQVLWEDLQRYKLLAKKCPSPQGLQVRCFGIHTLPHQVTWPYKIPYKGRVGLDPHRPMMSGRDIWAANETGR